MESSYWSRLLRQSVNRRRAMAGSAAAALGAAFLAACGGDGSSDAGGDKSGLLTQPVDTSKQAKRGGLLKHSRPADLQNWDANITSSNQLSFLAPLAFSRLLQTKAGILKESDGELIGDLAESWEWSPDRLQLTMKLRPGVQFHNVAPVNGRALDMDDVLFSWNRFATLGSRRSELFNNVNPNAPILSFAATDARTLVFKLKEPVVYVLNFMGISGAGNPHTYAKEAESQYDVRQKVIGTGPYFLAEHTPSVGTVWKRHTGYYDKERPYIDTINYPIIAEYAQGLAQLQAGGLHTYMVRAEDILGIKRSVPQLVLYPDSVVVAGQQMFFGWKPDPAERTPMRDVRLRQAYSMSWDRDLFIDVAYNVSKFEAEGLPVETRWNTALSASIYEGWWLNPKSKEFGENAKYFEKNIAEAKKLLTAAGHPNGVEVISNTFTTGEYGTEFPKYTEILEGMASEAGFKIVKNIVNYQSDFIPKYRDSKGNFEGLSYRSLGGGADDAVSTMMGSYVAKAGSESFLGFDAEGKGTGAGDPFLDEQLNKAKSEIDDQKRKAIVHDIQRYLAKTLYSIRLPGGSSGFQVAWPVLKNFQVFLGDRRPNFYNWLDETQAPEKRS